MKLEIQFKFNKEFNEIQIGNPNENPFEIQFEFNTNGNPLKNQFKFVRYLNELQMNIN